MDAITFAWERIKADPATIAGTIIVGCVLMWVVTLLGSAIVNLSGMVGSGSSSLHAGGGTVSVFAPLQFALMGVVQLANLVVYSFFVTGITRFSLNVARGAPYGFGDLWTGPSAFVPVLIANTLSGLAVGIGFVFLIVPGIVLALGTSMAVPLIVDRQLGPIEALTASWSLTEGHKTNILLLGLIVGAISIAGMCACGLGLLVALPISTIAYLYAYLRLSGQPVAAPPPLA